LFENGCYVRLIHADTAGRWEVYRSGGVFLKGSEQSIRNDGGGHGELPTRRDGNKWQRKVKRFLTVID